MNRLTKKYEDGSGYEPIETHNVCNVNLYDFNYNDYECCVDKLGKIEDLMEKYNIDSVEELDNILSMKYVIGGMRSGGKTLINKGILYNKISEQLGCPLEVIFKATENGIIDYEGKEHIVVYAEKYLFVVEDDKLQHAFHIRNYQKTWWLKGEKTNE